MLTSAPMIFVGGELHVPPALWIVSIGVTIMVLAFDVFVIGRKPHEPSIRECASYLTLYCLLAIAFGIFVFLHYGGEAGGGFISGWLTEYSLSVDNLFIFLIIMSKFAVPRQYQQFALMVGIILALIMRAVFIVLGAAVINAYSWVFYIFGAFLIWTAYKLAQDDNSEEEGEYREPRVVKLAKRILPATSAYHGTKLQIRIKGHRLVTPMLFVLLAIGVTDLLFAFDSIPAIYGLTREPYLVLMANIFALMGLRQLYFLIGGLLQRLVFLSKGLSFLLLFIGVKQILHALAENTLPFINGGNPVHVYEFPTWVSLLVIVATLAVTAIASMLHSRNDEVDPGEPKDVDERVAAIVDPHPEYSMYDEADPYAIEVVTARGHLQDKAHIKPSPPCKCEPPSHDGDCDCNEQDGNCP